MNVLERLRSIVKSTADAPNTLLFVRAETIADAVAELNRLECKTSSDAALIRAFREGAAVKDADHRYQRAAIYWWREYRKLTGETTAVKGPEAERNACREAEEAMEAKDAEIERLRGEVERLQSDVDRLMPLAAAVGECAKNQIPASVYDAFRNPSEYWKSELVRLREELAVAEARESQELREARAEIDRLGRCNDHLGRTHAEIVNRLHGEIERLKSLDREIVVQRGAAQAALRQIAEMARCGLEYPVDGKGGTDGT